MNEQYRNVCSVCGRKYQTSQIAKHCLCFLADNGVFYDAFNEQPKTLGQLAIWANCAAAVKQDKLFPSLAGPHPSPVALTNPEALWIEQYLAEHSHPLVLSDAQGMNEIRNSVKSGMGWPNSEVDSMKLADLVDLMKNEPEVFRAALAFRRHSPECFTF